MAPMGLPETIHPNSEQVGIYGNQNHDSQATATNHVIDDITPASTPFGPYTQRVLSSESTVFSTQPTVVSTQPMATASDAGAHATTIPTHATSEQSEESLATVPIASDSSSSTLTHNPDATTSTSSSSLASSGGGFFESFTASIDGNGRNGQNDKSKMAIVSVRCV
jgi:hypothetical protein